jgi:hypothetical protein
MEPYEGGSENEEPSGTAEDVDGMLLALVRGMDVVDALWDGREEAPGFPITVLVNGAMVSGRLIGVCTYLRATGERWRRLTGHDPRTGPLDMEEDYRELANNIEATVRESTDDYEPPRYLHLREAHMIAATGAVPSFGPAVEGLLMRIPLASVDGFSFGEISMERI